MAPISLADTLEFTRNESGGVQFTCNVPELPTDDSNLVVRAANSLAEHTGTPLNVSIHLEKVVPHGAGLGGGSSDAATTFLALNALFELETPLETLRQLAAEIGSDIPFFLFESVCDCGGRGEAVQPVSFPQELPILLLKPDFAVDTPGAYKAWKDSQELSGVDYAPQTFDWGVLENGLERPTFEKHLVLADMKTWLRKQPGVAGALMSGSGSTMFALLDSDNAAAQLATDAKAEFGETLWTHFCHTLSS